MISTRIRPPRGAGAVATTTLEAAATAVSDVARGARRRRPSVLLMAAAVPAVALGLATLILTSFAPATLQVTGAFAVLALPLAFFVGRAEVRLDNRLLAAEVRSQLAEVRASRARVVAAADEGRRRIERDLHDGTQQHLVTVALVLRLARDRLAAAVQTTGVNPASVNPADLDLAAVDVLLERSADGLAAALVELRELARGIHPAVLTESGLLAALQAVAARSLLPVDVIGHDLPPLPEHIAATAYYVVAEAITNAAKHAAAKRVQVQVRAARGRLLVTVADDGIGGVDPARGTGLAGLRDRVVAVDGRLTVDGSPGAGTSVHADLPLEPL